MTETQVRGPSTGRQVWNFTRHFLEMCLAMCVGGGILNILVLSPGQLCSAIPICVRRTRRWHCFSSLDVHVADGRVDALSRHGLASHPRDVRCHSRPGGE